MVFRVLLSTCLYVLPNLDRPFELAQWPIGEMAQRPLVLSFQI